MLANFLLSTNSCNYVALMKSILGLFPDQSRSDSHGKHPDVSGIEMKAIVHE